jgi:hypothetical protein
MDGPCEYCDQPDTSLLRIVLIGEIIRADEDTLYTLAGVCEALGLMQLSDDDDDGDGDFPPPAETPKRSQGKLRRIK